MHMLSGLDDSENDYLCASSKIGQYKTTDDDAPVVRSSLITVFNRMYLETTDLQDGLREEIEKVERGENVSSVQSTERRAAILADRKQADDDLMNAMEISAMLAMDWSRPQDAAVKYVDMDCTRYGLVLGQAVSLTREKGIDEFTKDSSLIVSALKSKRCRAK